MEGSLVRGERVTGQILRKSIQFSARPKYSFPPCGTVLVGQHGSTVKNGGTRVVGTNSFDFSLSN